MPKNNVVPFRKAQSYIISVSLETGCYRHVQIDAGSTLEQLHEAILNAFAFDDDHLHAFFMNGRAWDSYDCYYSQYADEGPFTNEVTLTEAGLAEGKKFLYLFDFGDEWRFACRVLHKIEAATLEPFCVRMKGDPPAQYGVEDDEDNDLLDEELAKRMLEAWKRLAVSEGKPAETLREMLACRDKVELVNFLKEFGATKVSRWSSDKLIEGIAGFLLKPAVLRDRLYCFDRKQWAFFQEAASQPIFQMAELQPELCALPHLLGLLQPYRSDDDGYCCVVPRELRDLLGTLLAEGLEADLERRWLLDEYAAASVNLYGIIPVAEFVELFNRQNDQKTERSEVLSILGKRMTAPDTLYCLWKNDDYLVHEILWEDDFADAEDCLAEIEGKPRYLPNKEELLRYADDLYFEQTPQLKAVGNYLTVEHGFDADQRENFLDELQELVFFGEPIGEAVELLADEYGVVLDMKRLQPFLKLLANVMNSTRIWKNKGHTPAEMYFLQNGTLPPALRITTKVGRNDPCPCGSGKKYKHCCGTE